MAGDWIPMRLDLPDDPAVIAMAQRLGIDEDAVVGKLLRVWGWFSTQSRNGHAAVTQVFLDRRANLSGFTSALLDAGWLKAPSAGVLAVPKWGTWLGESAKKRLKAARRQRAKRLRDGNDPVTQPSRSVGDKSVTTGQDRTVHIKDKDAGADAPTDSEAPLGKGWAPKHAQTRALCTALADGIAKWNPEARAAKTAGRSAKSLRGMDGLVTADGRDPDDVGDMLNWLWCGGYAPDRPDRFDWRRNVLSGDSLRRAWDQLADLRRVSREPSANGRRRP